MRSFVLPLLAPLLLANCTPQCPPCDPGEFVRIEGWKQLPHGKMGPDSVFYSPDGRFFAAFPGEPVFESVDANNEIGKLRQETFVVQETSTLAYVVAYVDYPVAHVRKTGGAEVLRAGLVGTLGGLGVSAYDERTEFLLNGNKGLQFRGHRETLFVSGKVLLVGNRLYIIEILRDASWPSPDMEAMFFNGFHLADMVNEPDPNKELWPDEMPGLSGDSAVRLAH